MATAVFSAPGLSAGPINIHDVDPETEERATKKAKLEPQTIGTHNGTFHCDEALAVFLLRHTNKYKNASELFFFLETGIHRMYNISSYARVSPPLL